MTYPIVVFRNMAEAYNCGRDITGAIVASASMPKSLRIVCSPTVYVSEGAAEMPGLLDAVRKRQASFKDATLEIMPAEHIRLVFGSAHDRMRLAAIRAGLTRLAARQDDPDPQRVGVQ